jgi:hypothetical protein
MEKVFQPVLPSLSTAVTRIGKDAVGLSLCIEYVLLHSPSLWNVNRYMPIVAPPTPKIIELSTLLKVAPEVGDAVLLLLLSSPTILVYIWGLIDRRKFIERYKLEIEEEKVREAVEETYEETSGL